MRLDFDRFTIAGPSTSTQVTSYIRNGQPVPNDETGEGATMASQCLEDRFVVSNPGGFGSSVICGENTGQHLYVETSAVCNSVDFSLGPSSFDRAWSIRVTQFSCDSPILAPPGCTQFHFGENSGTVQSFNFDGGHHLAGQNQRICFRRESGNCRICFSSVLPDDFSVNGECLRQDSLNKINLFTYSRQPISPMSRWVLLIRYLKQASNNELDLFQPWLGNLALIFAATSALRDRRRVKRPLPVSVKTCSVSIVFSFPVLKVNAAETY